ncbi:nucleotide-binding protein [Spongiibacter sp. KMU-166]|uniref:Nucleotide-binding protein n=1 Tax=Spongiibacter thalassae TaxID=2721624 RepID=A0ABX1GFK8_9GAMM|nr:TIR domain-containing protein [Spongiibacter thalassae]NKI17701.1 nucleotide-binding protein [Spongiibacter thalassae]
MSEDKANSPKRKNKKRLSQTDVPAYSLEHALRVPIAIFENYAGEPTKPIDVAAAMELLPNSSQFRMITGSAIAYGLTDGGPNSSEIGLTDLARKILQPLDEGVDIQAKRESLLKPRVIGEFISKYDGSPIPKDQIAQNVLISMGVPNERASDVLAMILEGAESLGLITEIKGRKYVNLTSPKSPVASVLPEVDNSDYEEEEEVQDIAESRDEEPAPSPAKLDANTEHKGLSKKVFVTHGKNKSFIEPIKKLLSFGEMEAVVSVEKQSVSQPVPDKVMNDMRECGAAIIHVEDELTLLDKEAKEHVMLNPNVLIEIGAAMALYKKRFILLVKEGVKLPSNLQGLYEVRYTGESMDGEATIKLLEAINAMKTEK